MTEVHKNSQCAAFYSLDKPRREAIAMLFEDQLPDELIAKKVNRTRRTLAKWKNDPKFQKGQLAYKYVVIKQDYESDAIKKLSELLEAKSEMVQLQAANSILKLSGMLSDNSTPELDQAKIRKANADARVAEARAKAMEDNGQDMETLLDKMLDTITKEDKKDES
ncbi:helix-turn-helix domain-containing protein [Limosilactobacillus reuteri]|uniref:helix-turn-helix domain-containing protein n=1 Tax=Limosilactobacillus reuteri TaxID=1598 RepID=UPI0017819F15|nr:helix-turn-helix domain-containing protein [Limosilactobacillus reuteri]